MQANLGLHRGDNSCNIMALMCAIYTRQTFGVEPK